MLHLASLCAGGIILFGYILFSYVLQLAYYHFSRTNVTDWKSQPRVQYNDDSLIPWLPILGRRINRAPEHTLFATCNLLLATTFAIVSTELLCRLKGKMYFNTDKIRADVVVSEVGAACLIELILEYVFHRLMHIEFFYKTFHKHHHFYKAPIPFDDMMIHPVEAFLYYCILYSPPFLTPISPLSHCLYMVIMGTAGILDHCGIRISLPFVYDSVFHDEHHRLFNVNYGFPFSTLDIVMGTYYVRNETKSSTASQKSVITVKDSIIQRSTRRRTSVVR